MGQPLMCEHLGRHKPDSYLVAEQDTLLLLYCFLTAKMCVWVERGRITTRRKEREKEDCSRCFKAVLRNAATVHEMDHYPSTAYHHVVDKSMALSAMTPCYSKHKALSRWETAAEEHSGQRGQQERVHERVSLSTRRVLVQPGCVLRARAQVWRWSL